MILEYSPGKKISIDGGEFKFGESRDLIRRRLGFRFVAEDRTIVLGESDSDVTWQLRDIYQNIKGSSNFLFFNYDPQNLLSELEVHLIDKIKLFDIEFDFKTSLHVIASEIERYADITMQTEGEFLSSDLRLNIMDKRRMGGSGNTLGYFYCASDVSHLEVTH